MRKSRYASVMPAKRTTPKKPKKPKKPQGQRFIEFAKEVGANDEKALDREFSKAVPPKKPKR